MIEYPYQPAPGSGQTLAPNAGVAVVALQKGVRQYCVENLAATLVYVRAAMDGSAATAADQVVPANSRRVFTKDGDCTVGSVFCAGLGSVHITSGSGN